MTRRTVSNRFIISVTAGALAVTGATLGDAVADEGDLPPISPAVLIDEITGATATTDTAEVWDIGATDLGVMWDDGAGNVLTAFGDTFATPGGDGAGTGNWRSNVLLRSSDTELADGMAFDWALTDESGQAVEIIGSQKVPGVEHTTIPTAGIEVDGRQYMAYMSVREWGPPGEWWTNFNQLAYSDDGGQTWSIEGAPVWENTEADDDPFQMVAYTKADGYVYMFGTPNGRLGAASVGRVVEDSMLDKDAYEYWDGTAWTSDYSASTPIIDPAVAELSVRYVEETGQWHMVYLNSNADMVLRVGDSPTSWGEEQLIATQAEYPGLYGGFIHPWSEPDELYLAMSIWNQYNVALVHVSLDDEGQVIRPNLLRDASFEMSDALNVEGGWELRGTGGIDTNSAWAKVGFRQFWVRMNAGTQQVVQEVAVTPYTDYRLTGWMVTGDSVGGGAGEGMLGVRQVGPGAVTVAEETFGDLAEYTKFTVEFNSEAHTLLEVFAGSTMTADRWVQGDNFNLVAVSDPGTPPTTEPTEEPTAEPTAEPTTEPTEPPDQDLYLTPGFHDVNGRQWMTVCEPYSQTTRCWTYIWATQIRQLEGHFHAVNGWAFNNLTYAPSPKSLWEGNPLATTGEFTGADGRAWRTECNTPATGGNGCRSYAEAQVVERAGDDYRVVTKWVFNNIVHFK